VRRGAVRPAAAAAGRESHARHVVETSPGEADDAVGRSGVRRAGLARPAGDDAGAGRVVTPVPGHAPRRRVGAGRAERAPRRAGPLGAHLIAGRVGAADLGDRAGLPVGDQAVKNVVRTGCRGLIARCVVFGQTVRVALRPVLDLVGGDVAGVRVAVFLAVDVGQPVYDAAAHA